MPWQASWFQMRLLIPGFIPKEGHPSWCSQESILSSWSDQFSNFMAWYQELRLIFHSILFLLVYFPVGLNVEFVAFLIDRTKNINYIITFLRETFVSLVLGIIIDFNLWIAIYSSVYLVALLRPILKFMTRLLIGF